MGELSFGTSPVVGIACRRAVVLPCLTEWTAVGDWVEIW